MATKKPNDSEAAAVPPDQMKLKAVQAERLSAMSGLEAKTLAGLTVADISQKFRFQLDPRLLLFRRVCGSVVKKDPVTGVEYPVPYATVHVEDTDCSLLGFFPSKSKWSWYFPFKCRREVIATAKTDECGNFCVWIPRWDIDWILRFRRERFCFPIIFERPSLRDLLEDLIPGRIPFPGPQPDPAPFLGANRGALIRRIEDSLGGNVARALALASSEASQVGARTDELAATLDGPALDQRIPPPLPKELARAEGVKGQEAVRSTLAAHVKMEAAALKDVDLRAYIGPFKRCIDIFVPEWRPFIDIPDITFRVTQDTNGDGVEETIYSEGFFAVRWNASGPIGPLKIQAKPNALAGLACNGGERIPCGNTPAIVLAGRMPVVNVPTIFDAANGYALRPNRPKPPALPRPNAATPFHSTVTLFGCNKTDREATHYRLQYKYSNDNGANFTDYTPFVSLTWPLFRLNAAGDPEFHYPAADTNGWYPINLPAGPNPFLPQDVILDWPTGAFANGRYMLKLELGKAVGNTVSSTSAEVAFNVDNSAPNGPLTVEWRKVTGGGAFQLLTAPCPVVRRGAVPGEIEFRVTMSASARHLRSATLSAGGCGGGDFVFISGNTEHWHVNVNDNDEVLQAIYRLPAATLEGTYSFSGHVSSRAMNPNGGDGGHLILPDPWEYDPDNIFITPYFPFSVINSD